MARRPSRVGQPRFNYDLLRALQLVEVILVRDFMVFLLVELMNHSTPTPILHLAILISCYHLVSLYFIHSKLSHHSSHSQYQDANSLSQLISFQQYSHGLSLYQLDTFAHGHWPQQVVVG